MTASPATSCRPRGGGRAGRWGRPEDAPRCLPAYSRPAGSATAARRPRRRWAGRRTGPRGRPGGCRRPRPRRGPAARCRGCRRPRPAWPATSPRRPRRCRPGSACCGRPLWSRPGPRCPSGPGAGTAGSPRMTTNQASDHSTPRTASRPSTRSSGAGLENSHQEPAAVSPAAPAVARPRPPMAASTVNSACPARRRARPASWWADGQGEDGQQGTASPAAPATPKPAGTTRRRGRRPRPGAAGRPGSGWPGRAGSGRAGSGTGTGPGSRSPRAGARRPLAVEPPHRVGQDSAW